MPTPWLLRWVVGELLNPEGGRHGEEEGGLPPGMVLTKPTKHQYNFKQAALEGDKLALTRQTGTLQTEVVSLQERTTALLSELEETRASVSKQRAEAAAAAGAGGSGGGGWSAGARGAAGAGAAGSDKEVLLRHIESLKEV
jgi:hypothetical protein